MPLSKSSMLAASVAGLAITVSFAGAQPYPSKAIRMVVPFPPGGPNDILGRLIAQRLTAQVGQQVVIDNRGGAGGIIGAELAARAVADGYTLLFGGTAPLSINPWLHKQLPYDPIKDFVAVSLVGTAPSLLVTHPNVPIPHTKLLQSVWGPDYGDEVEYLRVFINQLRKKIEKNPSNPKYLVTEPWVGYRFKFPE